jgi:hypothetical protein
MLSERGLHATGDPAVAQRIREMMQQRREAWLCRASHQHDHALAYKRAGGATVGLLEQPGGGDWKPFTCLNSLRDVESPVNLMLDKRETGMVLREDGP